MSLNIVSWTLRYLDTYKELPIETPWYLPVEDLHSKILDARHSPKVLFKHYVKKIKGAAHQNVRLTVHVNEALLTCIRYDGLSATPASLYQCPHEILDTSYSLISKTRMHSSRMRTGRSLTVCCSLLPGGGVPGLGGVVCSGGVCSQGVCLVWGGAWSGGGGGVCLLPGGSGYPSMH